MGTVVNGQSNGGSDQDYYKFTAKAGQRVIIDCWAYRIDSRMDPSLVLYDASGQGAGPQTATPIAAIRCSTSPCRPTATISSRCTTSSTPATANTSTG